MTYKNSILNAIKELDAIKKIYLSKESTDRSQFFVEAVREIIYNLDIAYQGIEYKSDEYQYLASNCVEVLANEDENDF